MGDHNRKMIGEEVLMVIQARLSRGPGLLT